VWNVWVIFTFVAIWHDFVLDLVLWAWFICLALIPEIIAKKWAHRQTHLWKTFWFKVIFYFLLVVFLCLLCGYLHLADGVCKSYWIWQWMVQHGNHF
jgi:hypothetical protein